MKDKNYYELLSPAGDFSALKAAVANGCNAVYVGGELFSARSFAKNFNRDEMQKAADYCHLNGCKLNVAVNTMTMENEIPAALDYCAFLSEAGADGIIIADTGLAYEIIKNNIKIPLHASTQMCVHNLDGVKLLQDAGFERAVLSRELSLKEIEYITQNSDIEIEVFIHGALCSGISGLCLMSSFIGARSGNRGKCAQPCRLAYEKNGEKKYFLSTGDLCGAGFMQGLMQAGVKSFKIEGRMKNPEYVGGVTAVYRELTDGICDNNYSVEDAREKLKKFYNRTFNHSYLEGKSDVLATDKPGNRNLDGEKIPVKQEGAFFKRSIDFEFCAKENSGIYAAAKSGDFFASVCDDIPCEKAKKEVKKELIGESLEKLGGTVFKKGRTDIEIKGNPFVAKSRVNEIRRSLVFDIQKSICDSFKREKQIYEYSPQKSGHSLKKLCVQIRNASLANKAVQNGADEIYFFPEAYNENALCDGKKIFEQTGKKPYIVTPPFLRESDLSVLKEFIKKGAKSFGGAVEGSFTQTAFLKDYFENIITDFTANTANSPACEFLREIGVTGVTLSTELSMHRIKELCGCLYSEITAYGYIPLMWNVHKGAYPQIKDRMGYIYNSEKLTCGRELYFVLNPVKLCIKELKELKNDIDGVRLILSGGDENVVALYRKAIDEKSDVLIFEENTTRGHLKRGV